MITRKVILWHVLFWFFTLADYSFISNWFAQQGLPQVDTANSFGVSSTAFQLIKRIPLLLLHIVFTYVNLLIFVPYFFQKKKYSFYILLLLAVTAIVYLPLRFLIEDGFYKWLGGTGLSYTNKVFWITDSSLYLLRLFLYGIAYYLIWRWLQTEKEKEELKTQNLRTELSFLKSQINPHFLFNTLSNLYSLAYKKSDKTADAILKLSEMMRYMLHESNKPQVPVEQEVRYLFNFIELQKLRSEKPCYISFSMNESFKDKNIPPLLLIPFVENIFKHGEINDPKNPVQIELNIKKEKLEFYVRNKIRVQEKDVSSGIGLQNISRRLELLSPGRHQLEITNNEQFHETRLILQDYE